MINRSGLPMALFSPTCRICSLESDGHYFGYIAQAGKGGTDVCCNTPSDTLAHPGSQGRPCKLVFVIFGIFAMSTWSVGHRCDLKFNIFLLFSCNMRGFWHASRSFSRYFETYCRLFDRPDFAKELSTLNESADPILLLYTAFTFGLIEGYYGAVPG